VSRRVAVEASSPTPWYRYVGLDGVVIGLTQFGLSAPQEDLRRHFRFTVDGCLSIIREKYTDLAVEKSDLF
jgi:transketolase